MEIREIKTNKELISALTLFQHEYGNMLYKNFGVERYKHFVLTNQKADEHVIKGMTVGHNYHGYIALDKGILIGMIIYMAPNYIRKIAVKSGFCHQGIGSALLEMVEDDITSKEVVVHAAAPSVDFYRLAENTTCSTCG